jgi:hypothetical protein
LTKKKKNKEKKKAPSTIKEKTVKYTKVKELKPAKCHQLMPIFLSTQKARIKRIMVQSQPRANSLRDSISKTPIQNSAGGVAQVVEYLLSKNKALSSTLSFKP